MDPKLIAADEPIHQAQYAFEGRYMPSVDPAKIGPTNYQIMQNLRYKKGEMRPEGVSGYTKINTTALTNYPYLKSGIQLKNYLSSTFSWLFVEAENAAGTERKIYVNKSDAPAAGDFEATEIHTAASGGTVGRFSYAPEGNITYANGKESCIYSGDAYPIAACFLCDDSSNTNPKDYTKEMTDETSGTMTIDAAGSDYAIVLSRRKLSGLNYTISSASSPSGYAVEVYTSSGFAAVAGTTDGTTSLASSGSVTFTSTVSSAVPMHFQGWYAYAYRFKLTSGSSVISFISANAPFQAMTDLWDGVARQPIFVQLSYDGTAKEDFTAYILNASDTSYPIGLDLSGTTTSGKLICIFEERMSAIDFAMLGKLVNATAGTVLSIKYWNGSAFAACSNSADSTSGFEKSGKITWTPPAYTSEFQVNIDDHVGYGYEISFGTAGVSGTHGGNAVVCDVLTGIPAQYTVPAFDWVSTHKSRIFGVRGNEVYYTPAGYADAWNGADSSMDGIQALVFGPGDKLTGGASLYNRYGNSVFEVWVTFSNGQTFQLKGDGPQAEQDPWRIDTISPNIGCPAFETICTAELGFEVSEDAKRNIVLWVSSSGPMAYDGAVLYPVKGMEKYFDPNDSECINFDAIGVSRAWYDPIYREWNVEFPSGVGQTTNNKWVVLDLEKQAWFAKYTGAKPLPMCGIQVASEDGNQFVYGGLNNGFLVRLEYGTSWDGAAIDQAILLGDIWPDSNMWHKTLIRRVKFIVEKTSTAHTLSLLYRADTSPVSSAGGMTWEDTEVYEWEDSDAYEYSSPSLTTMSLYSANSDRLIRAGINTNLIAWTHAIGASVSTTTENKCFRPIAVVIEYQIIRDDY